MAILKTPADRLRHARERAGYRSAAAFAAAFELTESAYRHKENNTRQITVPDAKLFARLLAKKLGPTMTWQYIINGDKPAAELVAKMIGYVGAGEAIIPFDDENAWEPVPAPPGLIDCSVATVQGNSMFPVFRQGDRLFFGPQVPPAQELVGKDCLVQILDGARQIKSLRRGLKRGYFRLYSYATNTESEDVRIEWAAPVRWIERST